ncbi:MAG: sigma-70 family RNA polymerase sigma factor [Lachnospiraceae bacterium]|nr:sigma-70 family RNA polymerase sigma factor [Lachnospiraceae bacterium]
MNTDCHAKELFERYSDMIYRIAISYGNSIPFAEDTVQEVFLRYLKKTPRFESCEHEKAWFIRVTVNYCKSTLSSAWLKRICPLESVEQISVPFQQEEENELYEMLSGLSSKYRIVLYLRYYEEYQVKEIAELLGITPNLVSARLARAKKLMKQKLLKEREEFQDGTRTV